MRPWHKGGGGKKVWLQTARDFPTLYTPRVQFDAPVELVEHRMPGIYFLLDLGLVEGLPHEEGAEADGRVVQGKDDAGEVVVDPETESGPGEELIHCSIIPHISPVLYVYL